MKKPSAKPIKVPVKTIEKPKEKKPLVISPEFLDRMEVLSIKFLREKPFYACMLMQMETHYTLEVPVAGVSILGNRLHLYINPEGFSKYTIKESIAILEHECLHLVFLHTLRCGGRIHKIFNCAADLAINSLVENLPKDCLFPKEWKPKPLMGGLTAEDYYDQIYKQFPKISINQETGEVTIEINGGESNSANGGETIKGKLYHDPKKFEEDSNKTENQSLVEEIIRAAVKEAYDNQHGNVPGNIARVVEELIKPPTIPWQVLLKQYVSNAIKCGTRTTWKRLSRRFGDQQQGHFPDRTIKIACAVDTSGSIGIEEFQEFMSEIKSIQRTHKGEITIIECDADIQRTYKLKAYDKLDVNFKGGGGTDFRPVFDKLEKERCADLLIYLTDLCGTFPESSKINTIWVAISSAPQMEVPFGRLVKIQNEKK